jgi:hypothetical protein
VDPFNVKNFRNDFRKRVVEAEDGVATIDWVVLLAALTGLGVAMLDVTGEPLGIHAQNVRGEVAGQFLRDRLGRQHPRRAFG